MYSAFVALAQAEATEAENHVVISFMACLPTCVSALNFSILHHLLCLSFLPCPRYNLWCSLLEEADLWGFVVL